MPAICSSTSHQSWKKVEVYWPNGIEWTRNLGFLETLETGAELLMELLKATLGFPAWLAGAVAPAVEFGVSFRGRLRDRRCHGFGRPLNLPAGLAGAVAPSVEFGIWISLRGSCSVD